MTDAERDELTQMVCGSAVMSRDCHNYKNCGRLVYDGTNFRCCMSDYCRRVTPKTGKLTKWTVEDWNYDSGQYVAVDKLKQSLVHRRIQKLKETPEIPRLKLVKMDNRVWVVLKDGTLENPKNFSDGWWTYRWDWDFE